MTDAHAGPDSETVTPHVPSADDDVRLARRFARGDKAAFAEWLAIAEEPVRRSLASFARTVDTEVVMQEALLRVWLTADRFESDGRPDGLVRYASRIARNCAIDEYRRLDRRRSHETPDGGPPPAAFEIEAIAARPVVTSDPGVGKVLEACIEELPPKPRLAMLARLRLGGRGDTAAAAEAGMTRNTFFQNVARARKAIVACLKDKGIDLIAEAAA